MGYINVFAYDI
nr:truncated ORF10 protein [Severe acute respiratory syndrome coronavirus 2]